VDFLQQAKRIWPGLSDKDMSIVLWSLTKYPMGDQDEVLADLRNAYEKSGGDFLQALHQADLAISQRFTSGQ
jgi:hypothetical protein